MLRSCCSGISIAPTVTMNFQVEPAGVPRKLRKPAMPAGRVEYREALALAVAEVLAVVVEEVEKEVVVEEVE